MRRLLSLSIAVLSALAAAPALRAVEDVYLTGVPDYDWWAGCFGTATGNLMGYWDRHGFENFYTGPTGGGVAPLNSSGGNHGIVSLWASQAGVDGRPSDQPGHYDDYYVDYESTAPDPYVIAGRAEHPADCLGDFTGLNQRKFPDLDGECSGNIDGYSFVYWDSTGDRRVNFTPTLPGGAPTVDIQSGLRAWTRWRHSECNVFTQLAAVNPRILPDKGFTFADMRAEIDAGYPVLLFLQSYSQFYRTVNGTPRVNPHLHGMLVYGYFVGDDGAEYLRCRTSWASGDQWLGRWEAMTWVSSGDLPPRGVIGYHPLPKILSAIPGGGRLKVTWQGPLAEVFNAAEQAAHTPHRYVVEIAPRLSPGDFKEASGIVTALETTIDLPGTDAFFLRVKLVPTTPGVQL